VLHNKLTNSAEPIQIRIKKNFAVFSNVGCKIIIFGYFYEETGNNLAVQPTINKMKKILLSSLALLMVLCSFGQTIKCKAYRSSYTILNETTAQWSEWKEWKDCDILTEIDFNTNQIRIFSEINQRYDIMEYNGSSIDADGDEVFEWYCRNEEGLACSIRLINSESTEISSIYVDFANCRYVYLVYLSE